LSKYFAARDPVPITIQPGNETYQYSYGSGVVSIRGSAGFGGYGSVKVFVDGIPFPGNADYTNTLDKK
jgi:hypothetical protein